MDGEEAWIVEQILDERTTKQGRSTLKQAHVKWQDYTEPTWEPVDNICMTNAWKKWVKTRTKKKGGGNVMG
jgi:hypothetical protein